MKTAIVILNWNGRKMMERFLPTVLKYSRNDAEVWVADNASTDGSMEMLAQKFPEVKTLVLDRNYGFADGYNRALQQIEADYYVLLNSDVEVTHHWLTPLQEYMDTHDDVAACQPKLLSEADKDSFEYAGASGGFLDRFGYPLCRGRVFNTVERDNGQYDGRQEHSTPASLLTTRRLTSVGDCDSEDDAWCASPKVRCTMSAAARCRRATR